MSDDRPTPPDAGRDPEISEGEPPQAMRVFNEPVAPDVHLDPDAPAFDRIQEEKEVDAEYSREYNRRYVKEHGDHHGHRPTRGPEAEDG